MMIVLGIDPGTATSGYGLVKANGQRLEVLKFGLIETDKNLTPEVRLGRIFKTISNLLGEFKPDCIAVEKVFFATNAKTAISVGQAQGVILLSAANARIGVYEYSPMTIKKVVSGNGHADKELMKKTIRKLLNVRSPRRSKTHFDNSVDALAVAVCHLCKTNGFKGRG